MQNVEKNLGDVRAGIEAAAKRYQRDPDSVSLLAVSKRKPAELIRQAFACGQVDFGENYLQEAQQKMQQLDDLDIRWHFIGAIQSNKTREIAESFDWVHCVDRFKIAHRLSQQRPDSMPPLNLCIQVNLDLEDSKAGIALDRARDLAAEIHPLPRLNLRGLMTIPAPRQGLEDQRAAFRRLAEAQETLRQDGIHCDTLSMGMTADMEAAIAEGSTWVRIGTAIFGERD